MFQKEIKIQKRKSWILKMFSNGLRFSNGSRSSVSDMDMLSPPFCEKKMLLEVASKVIASIPPLSDLEEAKVLNPSPGAVVVIATSKDNESSNRPLHKWYF